MNYDAMLLTFVKNDRKSRGLRALKLVFLPWLVVKETRGQLTSAFDAYRAIFDEWTLFYQKLDDRMKPAYKDRATAAIDGMTNSAATDRVVELDERYKRLCQPSVSFNSVHDQAGRINMAFDTTREQVAELALALTKAQSDLDAAKVAAAQHGEYLKIVGQPRDLQAYLAIAFPMTWKALSDGRPLVEIATHILTQLKDGRVVN